MNAAKVLVAGLMLVFTAFLFPTLQTACRVATGDLAVLIQNFPVILLLSEVSALIYLTVEDKLR